MIFVATLGKMPRFLWRFLSLSGSSSSPVLGEATLLSKPSPANIVNQILTDATLTCFIQIECLWIYTKPKEQYKWLIVYLVLFLFCFVFFQDKEKEQGLGSKVVRSKELLPKNSGKGQREWREIANLFSSFLCCHGNDSDVYSWDVLSETPAGESNMVVAMGRGSVLARGFKPTYSPWCQLVRRCI